MLASSIEDLVEPLNDLLAGAGADLAVPGAAVGVLGDGRSHFVTAGVGNAELGRPVTADTLFQVGSISKTFTSAAVMLLCRDGDLALSDPVANHLPNLSVATGIDFEQITIEQLLSHQSGFDGDHLLVQRDAGTIEALRGARVLFPPGQGYSYSNAAFSVVGVIVEAVSGRPFADFVRERLLRPLGIDGAAYRADDVVLSDVAAPHWVLDRVAHVIRGAGWQPGWQLEPVDFAAGGLIASVDHLLTWSRFQLDGRAADGTELLDAEQLARLHRPNVTADRRDRIALDWFVREIDGVTTIGHGGATAGYISDLLILPGRKLAVACLTNSTNGANLIQLVRRWVLEHAAGAREEDPVPEPTTAPPMDRVVGRYLHAFGSLAVEPGPTPGTIVLETHPRTDGVTWQPPADPPRTLAFVAPDTVVTTATGEATALGTFGFDATGNATWLNWHARRAPRLTES